MNFGEMTEIKVCVKCGKEQSVNSKSHSCSYCGGTLTTKHTLKREI